MSATAVKSGEAHGTADHENLGQDHGTEVRSSVEKLARAGYTAKGVVYTIVGVLAAQAAIQAGGDTEGSEGALMTILRQPFGRILLGVMTLGLIGYVVWRLVQTVADPEDGGTDAQGLGLRAFYLASALSYSGLVVFAVRVMTGRGGGGEDGGTQARTAELMAQPFGRWLVGLAGVAVLVAAAQQFYKAATASFKDRLG